MFVMDWAPSERGVKIAQVHNRYGAGAPSGENTVVDRERELLEIGGHTVHPIYSSNDELLQGGHVALLAQAGLAPWNPFTAEAVVRVIDALAPDVAHVHNIFPKPTIAVLRALQDRRLPVVMTAHSYRFYCSGGVATRAGAGCSDCLSRKFPWPAVKHRCYRGGFVSSGLAALAVWNARRLEAVNRWVQVVVALSQFQRRLMVQAGIRDDLIVVRPNFASETQNIVKLEQRSGTVLFVGRLSSEKGLSVLLRAWELLGAKAPPLRIIGTGPLASDIQKQVETNGLTRRVKLLGALKPDEVKSELAAARLVVVPSLAYEGFPLVIAEAFSAGTPVLASNVGSLSEIVSELGTHFLFAAGSEEGLAERVEAVFGSDSILSDASGRARALFESRYSPERALASLEDIYHLAKSRQT